MWNLGGPVAEQHTQSDVLNHLHGRGDLSAGEFRVVFGLGGEFLGEVRAPGDLPDELLGRFAATRVTRPAKSYSWTEVPVAGGVSEVRRCR